MASLSMIFSTVRVLFAVTAEYFRLILFIQSSMSVAVMDRSFQSEKYGWIWFSRYALCYSAYDLEYSPLVRFRFKYLHLSHRNQFLAYTSNLRFLFATYCSSSSLS